ncbi:hypothetical protein KSP39_PZI021999 [Platanthera zijinensis]|uniref:Uncharacterized protein n=1 Tax=Platanthera zijinensis TaxID=2320716 RepID=A0AAP0AYC4_9ASPA
MAFGELYVHLMLPQLAQLQCQMLGMLLLYMGLDQNVVDEDYNKSIQEGLKETVHQTHKYGR